MRPQIVMLIPLGDAPVDPGFGVGAPRPPGSGNYPDQGLPGQGGHPDQSLPPMPPGWETFPKPTPPQAGHPAHPIILPGDPTHPIAQPPGTIWPNIPEVHVKAGLLAWVPGYGYRWIVVQPPVPGQPLPPTAQPKA